jgi:hypothetical protein
MFFAILHLIKKNHVLKSNLTFVFLNNSIIIVNSTIIFCTLILVEFIWYIYIEANLLNYIYSKQIVKNVFLAGHKKYNINSDCKIINNFLTNILKISAKKLNYIKIW